MRWKQLVILTVLAICFGPGCGWAAVQTEGRGDVRYELGLFDSKPSPKVREQAVELAKRNALLRYTSTFSPSKTALFQKVSAQVLSHVDQYVIDAIIVDEGMNKDAKVYYAIVRANINDAKLDAVLNQEGLASAEQHMGSERQTISFLFVAREASSVKLFDTRRTVVSDVQQATSANQTQGVSGGSAQLNETSQTTKTATSGGSSLRKRDEVSYRVTSPEDMNTAMNAIFVSRGIEVADYRDVVSSCGGVEPEKIYAEFSKSDELSRQTRNVAFASARKCDVTAFAIGTMDVGLPDIDPVTGNKRVAVSVRSQLLDISRKLPRVIASVGPVQYTGLGPSPEVAQRNALQQAASNVAKNLSDQLSARSFH